MAPIYPKYSLKNRYSSNIVESVEPFKKYFILCEGNVTEIEYFSKISESSNLNIRPDVEVIVFERKGDSDIGKVDPRSLRDFLIKYIKKHHRQPNSDYVMVFDIDTMRNDGEYANFIEETNKKYKIRTIGTFPCIELWFILHKENSLNEYIKPNEMDIFLNKKISRKHTFTSKMCSGIWKSNPKKYVNLCMVENLYIAIKQAQNLENDISLLNSKIGTNIHILMQELIEDKRFLHDN